MGMPYSVEEIDNGMIAEGIDQLLDSDNPIAIEEYKMRQELSREQHRIDKKQGGNFGYWTDNCGDDV